MQNKNNFFSSNLIELSKKQQFLKKMKNLNSLMIGEKIKHLVLYKKF